MGIKADDKIKLWIKIAIDLAIQNTEYFPPLLYNLSLKDND